MSTTSVNTTNTGKVDLSNVEVILAMDFSASMKTKDAGSGGALPRLDAMHETVKGMAEDLEPYDQDGITIIKFAGSIRLYDNQKAAKVDDIFAENRAAGGTCTDQVIKLVGERFLKPNQAKNRPVFLCIFTDGKPENELGTAEEIAKITKMISHRREVGILFVQVGKDAEAEAYLTKLNNDLASHGADHDIVAVRKLTDLESLTTDEIITLAFTE